MVCSGGAALGGYCSWKSSLSLGTLVLNSGLWMGRLLFGGSPFQKQFAASEVMDGSCPPKRGKSNTKMGKGIGLAMAGSSGPNWRDLRQTIEGGAPDPSGNVFNRFVEIQMGAMAPGEALHGVNRFRGSFPFRGLACGDSRPERKCAAPFKPVGDCVRGIIANGPMASV